MHKAGMERGFAKNVKIDFACIGVNGSFDAFLEKGARHKGSGVFDAFGCVVVRMERLSARAKAAMQIAYVRDFDIDAFHLDCPGFGDSITCFAFCLQHRNCFDVFVQLAGFLDFLECLL